MSRRLPKSLHTITVLSRFASHVRSSHGFTYYQGQDPGEVAMDKVLEILGLAEFDDEYELAKKSLKKMAEIKERRNQ